MAGSLSPRARTKQRAKVDRKNVGYSAILFEEEFCWFINFLLVEFDHGLHQKEALENYNPDFTTSLFCSLPSEGFSKSVNFLLKKHYETRQVDTNLYERESLKLNEI